MFCTQQRTVQHATRGHHIIVYRTGHSKIITCTIIPHLSILQQARTGTDTVVDKKIVSKSFLR